MQSAQKLTCGILSLVSKQERFPSEIMAWIAMAIEKNSLHLQEMKGMAVSFVHHSSEISIASAPLVSSYTVMRT